ncbi:MAG: transposase [Proteobacteria bacterium]|nr:transposase [Pseudomonadota bacterium]
MKRADDVRSALAGHPSGTAWIDREMAGSHLPDERLERRRHKLLAQLSARTGNSLPMACQDWSNTKAAYRFLSNGRVSEAEILAGHFQATRERFAATKGWMLVVHDTTELSFKRESMQAVGMLGTSFVGRD